jgi:uncharacterized RDD family membrane protein YckC
MTAHEYITRVLDALPPNMPSRDQIAMELRGLIDERLERGQSMEEVQRQLGDPLVLADSYLSALPLEPATFFSRVWAKLLDAGFFVALAVVLACTAWFTLPREVSPFVVAAVVVACSFGFAIYTIVSERRSGQTMGKRIMGLRAVRESGARIGLGQAVVRQLPMFLELFAIDALFALFTEKHQRAFELLSKTRVVKS